MTTLKAVYIGNDEGGYYGFTVGREYEAISYVNDSNLWVVDDDFCPRNIKNDAFHKFDIREQGEGFVTENECAVKATDNNKKPYLRYYINGHEVDVIEFESVGRTVYELDRDGVKCDTIKFEVKFE